MLVLLLSKYFLKEHKFKSEIILSLLVLYPSMAMVDAGFIATTLNYLWPVTLGLFSLLPLWNAINGNKTKIPIYIFAVPCLLYACNMQQMTCVLLLLFVAGNIYLIYNKKFNIFTILETIITAACLVYSYLRNTTGDNPRMLKESSRYFPAFSELNIFKKAELGFSSTFFGMTMDPRTAFAGSMIFFIFLAVLIFKNRRGLLSKAAALIPILFSVFGLIQAVTPLKNTALVSSFIGEYQNYRMNHAVYTFNILMDIAFLIIVLCTVFVFLQLTDNNRDKIIAFFAYFIGLGTRMIMGFSPTVWASGYRTYYIFFICLIIISIIIIDGGTESKEIREKNQES